MILTDIQVVLILIFPNVLGLGLRLYVPWFNINQS